MNFEKWQQETLASKLEENNNGLESLNNEEFEDFYDEKIDDCQDYYLYERNTKHDAFDHRDDIDEAIVGLRYLLDKHKDDLGVDLDYVSISPRSDSFYMTLVGDMVIRVSDHTVAQITDSAIMDIRTLESPNLNNPLLFEKIRANVEFRYEFEKKYNHRPALINYPYNFVDLDDIENETVNEVYTRRVKNEKLLKELSTKHEENEEFTKEELCVLYEINGPSDTFTSAGSMGGISSDNRVYEFRKERNIIDDYRKIYETKSDKQLVNILIESEDSYALNEFFKKDNGLIDLDVNTMENILNSEIVEEVHNLENIFNKPTIFTGFEFDKNTFDKIVDKVNSLHITEAIVKKIENFKGLDKESFTKVESIKGFSEKDLQILSSKLIYFRGLDKGIIMDILKKPVTNTETIIRLIESLDYFENLDKESFMKLIEQGNIENMRNSIDNKRYLGVYESEAIEIILQRSSLVGKLLEKIDIFEGLDEEVLMGIVDAIDLGTLKEYMSNVVLGNWEYEDSINNPDDVINKIKKNIKESNFIEAISHNIDAFNLSEEKKKDMLRMLQNSNKFS